MKAVYKCEYCDKIFAWKILEVVKYDPKKVIFNLIEKGYIKEGD